MQSIVNYVMFPLANKSKEPPTELEQYVYLKHPNNVNRKVILYAHGNSALLKGIKPQLMILSEQIQVDVFAFEFPGYGRCVGETNGDSVKAATRRAHTVLIQKYSYLPENVILMGRSIGTGPILWLSTQIIEYHSVILISPFTSITDLIYRYNFLGLQHVASYFYTETFDNISNAARCNKSILFIHGSEDNIIPVEMSISLHEHCPSMRKRLCIVSDATHNSIELWDLREILKFISD